MILELCMITIPNLYLRREHTNLIYINTILETRIGVFAQGKILCISPKGLQAWPL